MATRVPSSRRVGHPCRPDTRTCRRPCPASLREPVPGRRTGLASAATPSHRVARTSDEDAPAVGSAPVSLDRSLTAEDGYDRDGETLPLPVAPGPFDHDPGAPGVRGVLIGI